MKALLIFLFTLTSSTFAAKSLEWQKIELEKDIRSQYEQVVLSVTERKNFFVSAEVKYSDPGMPRFKDLNEDSLRISDISFDDSKGDYIAFSKIGLEVPILGKAFKGNQKQLKEMYRYNESYDLFKNIQSLDVQITLDSNLPDITIQNVKKVVKSFKVSVVNFSPKVEFVSVDLSDGIQRAPAKEKSLSIQDVVELIGKFGNAIGMILTVLLLGFLAFKLLRTYMEFMEKLKAMETPTQKEESSEDENNQRLPEATAEAEPLHVEELLGIERFEKLIELNLDQAVYLVKKWIINGDAEEKMALSAVAQQLSHGDLEKLYSHLNEEKRMIWNEQIDKYLEGEKLQKINKFISEQVVRELVAGSVFEDFELMDMLLSMNKETVKEYILESEEYGKFLSNCLSSNILAELMNELSPEELDKVVTESMTLSQSELKAGIPSFKADLANFVEKFKSNTFSSKLLGVVSEMSIEKEKIIYGYLNDQGNKYELKRIAIENIPSTLVFKLPEEFVKNNLSDYPLDQKIELLASVEEDVKTQLIDLMAPPNSNSREMIEMEMEILLGDEVKLARIKRDADIYLQKYVDFTRGAMKSHPELKAQVEEIVSVWIQDMTHAPHLKSVS